jgi:hypothetical protein
VPGPRDVIAITFLQRLRQDLRLADLPIRETDWRNLPLRLYLVRRRAVSREVGARI